MAMLPFQPTPFFANKNRAFWTLHIAGWGGLLLLRAVTAIANSQPLDLLIVIAVAVITGFSISTVLAVIYRKLINLRPLVTWVSTAIVLLVAVATYAFVDAWAQDLYYFGIRETSFLQRFFGLLLFEMALLGAWSALYYAINFFLQVEEQADQLLRLEMQATSAQLAMLRYQLNPHFLFNTLNSISTLVLLKQTEPANAMLTRLSSFLRHTLINQPSGKVTLMQEIETLKLYLEIERMRFEERLRTEFTIDPRAAEAQLPSMLLQPLIENAIKYAVSVQEEGARISLSAQIVGQRLRVAVSDTGPGITADGSAQRLPASITGQNEMSSTGVGLANIRDRLAQAYGDDHLFEIRTPPEGGFTVIIELPYETVDQSETQAAADERGVRALPEQSGQPAISSGPEPSLGAAPVPVSQAASAPPAQAASPASGNAQTPTRASLFNPKPTLESGS